MKILITRFDDPGDILFTTPVIRCIKKQVPGAVIHFLLKPEAAGVLQHNRYVDHIFFLNGNKPLKNENYELLIDLQDTRESHEVTKELGIKSYVVPKISWMSKIFKPLGNRDHNAARFIKVLASLELRNDGQGLDFFIPASEIISGNDIPASHQLGYIALTIGGLSSAERISIKNLREFCRDIDHPVILLGDAAASFAGAEISSADPVKIYNACGKFSFNETADLIKRSKILISYDKGMIALASALRKPVISIRTGNGPLADMQPFYPDADVMKTPPSGILKNFNKDVLLDKVRTILVKIQNSNSLTEG